MKVKSVLNIQDLKKIYLHFTYSQKLLKKIHQGKRRHKTHEKGDATEDIKEASRMVMKIQDNIRTDGLRSDNQNQSRRMESSRGHKHTRVWKLI